MIVDRIVPDLRGKAVFVVEDEFSLAMEIKSEVERAGGDVVGPSPKSKKRSLRWTREFRPAR